MDILVLAVLVLEHHIKGFGEVLAKVVGGAGLEGFAVGHDVFAGGSVDGAGELFGLGFEAFDHGDGHQFFVSFSVEVECIEDLLPTFFVGGVRSVCFLPEEFGTADERIGALFPADDVVPLVEFEW